MIVPTPAGPLSAATRDYLTRPECRGPGLPQAADATGGRDRALALWMLLELSFRGFDGVEEDLEWDASVVRLRSELADDLEAGLRRDFEELDAPTLEELIADDSATEGVSAFVRRRADREDVLEILRQKSVYHLKEADPHCLLVPRLGDAATAALIELQYDELGNGKPERVHAALFAEAMTAAGLDPSYGAYVDTASESTLTVANGLSLLCLRGRLRFAALGHLATFEATSSLPCADMVRGLRRLGFDERVAAYYDEHVEADAVHEHLALDLAHLVAGDDPDHLRELAFGAFVCIELEARNARTLVRLDVAA